MLVKIMKEKIFFIYLDKVLQRMPHLPVSSDEISKQWKFKWVSFDYLQSTFLAYAEGETEIGMTKTEFST